MPNLPVLNKNLHFRTSTPSQSEILYPKSSLAGPVHPSKEKYPQFIYMKYSLSGPAHPPKEKYSQILLKLVIKCIGDTVYDSYIAETLVPLKSTTRPKKQSRFEGNPVTSARHIPARHNKQPPPPKRTIDSADLDFLIPIELSQVSMDICVQDLGDIEAGKAIDTSIAHTPPSQSCGQFQAQQNDNSKSGSIAHFRTNTPSQSEIFPHNNRN